MVQQQSQDVDGMSLVLTCCCLCFCLFPVVAPVQDQLLDLKKIKTWLSSRGDEAWAWNGAGSSLLEVRGHGWWWGKGRQGCASVLSPLPASAEGQRRGVWASSMCAERQACVLVSMLHHHGGQLLHSCAAHMHNQPRPQCASPYPSLAAACRPVLCLLPVWLQTVEGDVSVIFSAEEMEEVLAKSKDKLVVLFCGLTWCRWVAGCCTTGRQWPCKAGSHFHGFVESAREQEQFVRHSLLVWPVGTIPDMQRTQGVVQYRTVPASAAACHCPSWCVHAGRARVLPRRMRRWLAPTTRLCS